MLTYKCYRFVHQFGNVLSKDTKDTLAEHMLKKKNASAGFIRVFWILIYVFINSIRE